MLIKILNNININNIEGVQRKMTKMTREVEEEEYEQRLKKTKLMSLEMRHLIVQRHSKKYETNCSNCSKSTKIGTHVD